MSRPTYLEINASALRYNTYQVKALAPHSAIVAMVKANGYGHSDVVVAKAAIESGA